MITGLITAARTYAEAVTGRSLASKDYIMTLDSFPYYIDSVSSQEAYPPSYYALPRYSTTLWNYSQMLKLSCAPVTDVSSIVYIDVDGDPQTLLPGIDFIVDYAAENCRIFTLPGAFWPPTEYVTNAVIVNFTAGYDPDPTAILTIEAADLESLPTPPDQQASYTLAIGIPMTTHTALMMLVGHWYFNREPVAGGSVGSVPIHIDALLASDSVFDFSSTRG